MTTYQENSVHLKMYKRVFLLTCLFSLNAHKSTFERQNLNMECLLKYALFFTRLNFFQCKLTERKDSIIQSIAHCLTGNKICLIRGTKAKSSRCVELTKCAVPASLFGDASRLTSDQQVYGVRCSVFGSAEGCMVINKAPTQLFHPIWAGFRWRQNKKCRVVSQPVALCQSDLYLDA